MQSNRKFSVASIIARRSTPALIAAGLILIGSLNASTYGSATTRPTTQRGAAGPNQSDSTFSESTSPAWQYGAVDFRAIQLATGNSTNAKVASVKTSGNSTSISPSIKTNKIIDAPATTPLPSAAWAGLITLGGLGLLAATRKTSLSPRP